MEPAPGKSLFAPVTIAALFGVLGGACIVLLARQAPPAAPVPVVRPSPSVITAVRDLSRLETTSFHAERVIELTDTQEHLFGLVHGDDSILLVAAADVIAGVDLSGLDEHAIEIDEAHHRATITLPHAMVLATVVDEAHTYVHARTTDLLAQRREDLETLARREAQTSLEAAAVEAGVLARADRSAARTVEALVRSLGYTEVTVRTAD